MARRRVLHPIRDPGSCPVSGEDVQLGIGCPPCHRLKPRAVEGKGGELLKLGIAEPAQPFLEVSMRPS